MGPELARLISASCGCRTGFCRIRAARVGDPGCGHPHPQCAASFFDFLLSEIGITPIWMCPFKTRSLQELGPLLREGTARQFRILGRDPVHARERTLQPEDRTEDDGTRGRQGTVLQRLGTMRQSFGASTISLATSSSSRLMIRRVFFQTCTRSASGGSNGVTEPAEDSVACVAPCPRAQTRTVRSNLAPAPEIALLAAGIVRSEY